MKPNFNTMSKRDLRAYVIQHPGDRKAFHTLVDKLTASPPGVTYRASMSAQESQNVILDRIKHKQKSADPENG